MHDADETVVWQAALLQALQDATLPEDVVGPVSIERGRALAWVFASIGVTAEDFLDVCDMAGIDSTLFREHAHSFIKSGRRFYLRNDKWTTLTAPSGSE